MIYTEIPATEIRKGDIIDLVHEVVSVRHDNRFGDNRIVVRTRVLNGRGSFVAMSKRVLFSYETVMRADA
jgi:hypothetical protein